MKTPYQNLENEKNNYSYHCSTLKKIKKQVLHLLEWYWLSEDGTAPKCECVKDIRQTGVHSCTN